jgi:hypothetical protein
MRTKMGNIKLCPLPNMAKGDNSYISHYTVKPVGDLKILQQIIRRSYEALSDDPRQLASQLLNRLDDKVN